MNDRRDAIREAQHNRQRLIEAHAVLAVMNIEKEDDYPGWDRRDKVRFTKRYNAHGQYIIELQGWLQDAPPAPLHPADALGKLAEVLQEKIFRHWVARRILHKQIDGWAGGSWCEYTTVIAAEWHAIRAARLASIIAEFEGDDLARWDRAFQVLGNAISIAEDAQKRFCGGSEMENIQASARVVALRGWLQMRHYAHDYDKLDARVQVWAELKAMEKEATQ